MAGFHRQTDVQLVRLSIRYSGLLSFNIRIPLLIFIHRIGIYKLKFTVMELSEIFTLDFFGWIQGLIALAILVLFVVKAIDLFFRESLPDARLRSGIHTVIFLGSFAGVFGFLIQIIGIVEALAAIIEAADVSPQILWAGAKRSFYNPIFGLITFLVSGILWFILQARYRNLLSKR